MGDNISISGWDKRSDKEMLENAVKVGDDYDLLSRLGSDTYIIIPAVRICREENGKELRLHKAFLGIHT